MSRSYSFKKVTQKIVGVMSISTECVEELRTILETEQKRQVTSAEAKEYGESLITVYKVLAGDREILGVNKTEDNTNG